MHANNIAFRIDPFTVWLIVALTGLVLALAALAGCASAGTPASAPTATSAPAPTAAPTATPVQTPAPTAAPASTPTAAPFASASPTAPAPASPPPPTATSAPQVPSASAKVTIGEGSKARYLSREQLANRNLPNDAVGETPDVSGTIAFDANGAVLQEQSKITVNLRTLRSDEDRRDNFIRENTIQTSRFPTAEFAVSSAPGLPWPLPESGEATFQLQGNMTMHGVTSPMVWDVTAGFDGDKVTGQAKSSFTFEQFKMDKPRVFLVLSVEDTVRLEVDFRASISQ